MTLDDSGQRAVANERGAAVPVPLSPRTAKRKEPRRNAAYWERKKARRTTPEYRAARRPYHIAYNRYRRTGITPLVYDRLMVEQNGACLLCNQVMKLYVDHDHVTGRIRGLLCNSCNTGLARAEVDPTWLDRARRYLNHG